VSALSTVYEQTNEVEDMTQYMYQRKPREDDESSQSITPTDASSTKHMISDGYTAHGTNVRGTLRKNRNTEKHSEYQPKGKQEIQP